MLPLVSTIAKGIVIGLGAAVPIGPVNVQIARRALRNGFLAGVFLGAGAVTVDVFFASVSCLSLGRALNHPVVYRVVTVGGILMLTYLGVQCLRAAWTKQTGIPEAVGTPPAGVYRGYLLGLMMTLLNPMTLAFWFVVLPATVGPSAPGSTAQLPLLCIGVFVGTFAWVIWFAGTLCILGSFRKNLWLVIADTVGGVTLLSFALLVFLRSIRVPL